MTGRELRLRRRIDQLTDERDQAIAMRDHALAELDDLKADIKAARAAATRSASSDPAYGWLAEYDRRRDARRKRRRARQAA